MVWIWRALWEKKAFNLEDCYPVGQDDVWDSKPKSLNFTSLFWGDDSKKSFLRVVRESMANRSRGRGSRL